jgi:hypothetical protein
MGLLSPTDFDGATPVLLQSTISAHSSSSSLIGAAFSLLPVSSCSSGITTLQPTGAVLINYEQNRRYVRIHAL